MSSSHSGPMATRSGPSKFSHPKTSPTPLITPQGARPASAWAYPISEVHPKNWPEFKKKMESGLTTSPSTPCAPSCTTPKTRHHITKSVASSMKSCVQNALRSMSVKLPTPWRQGWNLRQMSPQTVVGDHEHPIKKDNVKVITREDNMWRRKICESIKIRTCRPAIKRDRGYELPLFMKNCCHRTAEN